MRRETHVALINSYIGMTEDDPRYKAVNSVLDSNAGRAIVDSLFDASTDDNSRLDFFRNYARREEAEQPLLLAAELLLAESVFVALNSQNEQVDEHLKGVVK